MSSRNINKKSGKYKDEIERRIREGKMVESEVSESEDALGESVDSMLGIGYGGQPPDEDRI